MILTIKNYLNLCLILNKQTNNAFELVFGSLNGEGTRYNKKACNIVAKYIQYEHNYRQACYNPRGALLEMYGNIMRNLDVILRLDSFSFEDIESGAINVQAITNMQSEDLRELNKGIFDELDYLTSQTQTKNVKSRQDQWNAIKSGINMIISKVMMQNTHHYFTKFNHEVVIYEIEDAKYETLSWFYFDKSDLRLDRLDVDRMQHISTTNLPSGTKLGFCNMYYVDYDTQVVTCGNDNTTCSFTFDIDLAKVKEYKIGEFGTLKGYEER